jgi:hypothetical protein
MRQKAHRPEWSGVTVDASLRSRVLQSVHDVPYYEPHVS